MEVLLPVAVPVGQYLYLTPGMDQTEATALIQLHHQHCIKLADLIAMSYYVQENP